MLKRTVCLAVLFCVERPTSAGYVGIGKLLLEYKSWFAMIIVHEIRLLAYQLKVLMAMVQIGRQTCQPNAYCLPKPHKIKN